MQINLSNSKMRRQSLIDALVSKASDEPWRHCNWGHSYCLVESKYFIYIVACTPYGGYSVWDFKPLTQKEYLLRDWEELTEDHDRNEPHNES